jgi:hypothetical protein
MPSCSASDSLLCSAASDAALIAKTLDPLDPDLVADETRRGIDTGADVRDVQAYYY